MMIDQEDHKDDIDGKYDRYDRPNRLIDAMEEAPIFKLHESHDGIDMPLLNPDMNRSLIQSILIECVHNESEIRLAIDNALNFVPTRITICSSPILLNASEPNAVGTQGIFIYNKNLEFHCHVTDQSSTPTKTTTARNCILDGQSLSRIFFVFTSNLTFHGIDFINGNGNVDLSYSSGGAFYVDLGSNIKMMNCAFMNNTARSGGAMMVFDSMIGIIVHENQTIPSVVQNNIVNRSGGFIYAENSKIDMNNVNMKSNTATFGGAIVTYDSILKLIGSDNPKLPTIVQNNLANRGGGFIEATNSTIELYNINMKSNTATFGGAIYASDSALKLIGSDYPILPTMVENNVANISGGFIYFKNSTLEMYSINMINNTAANGGAIVAFNSDLKLIGSDDPTLPTLVANNAANLDGGFINAYHLMLEMYNINMKNNTAANGGAITIFDSALKLIGSDDPIFPTIVENNMANDSGGFIAAQNSTLIMYNINMKSNTATFGGAIVTYDSTLKFIGSDNPTLPTNVENNIANRNGGFIYALNSTLDMYNINIKHNAATFGGAIITFDSTLKLIGSDDPTFPTLVENNIANSNGGFIYAQNSTLVMYNINMKYNTATTGGAIVTFDSALKLIGSDDPKLPTIIQNNVATNSGGVVAASDTTLVITQGYFLFRNNTAKNVRSIFKL
jgi:predicted outer membrane repeat protein